MIYLPSTSPFQNNPDFSLCHCQVLSVEFIHGKEGKDTLRKYMEERNYWVYKEFSRSNGWANDFIFVRKDFLTKETRSH